jgi:hypothetical protein
VNDGPPICPGCGNAIWPNEQMKLMTATVEDPATGEKTDTMPTPIHDGCEDAFRARVEG